MNNRHFSAPSKVHPQENTLRIAGSMHVLSVLRATTKLKPFFTPTTIDVLKAMIENADAATRETFASVSKIARTAGTCDRMVRRSLVLLRGAGLVETVRKVSAGEALPTPRGWETIRATRETLVHRLTFEDGKSLLQTTCTHFQTADCGVRGHSL